jgi:hypothetical protein
MAEMSCKSNGKFGNGEKRPVREYRGRFPLKELPGGIVEIDRQRTPYKDPISKKYRYF